MKTMERLVAHFNRVLNPEISFWLDKMESYPGCYRIAVTDGLGMTGHYIFRTCREFEEWANAVVFD